MIKIFQVNSYSGLGGGQRVMFDIVQGLKDKFEFIIIAPSGPFLKKYSQIGWKVEELTALNPFQVIKQVRNFIKKETPDILHIHGTRAAFWVRLAVIWLKNRPKLIYTLHGFHIVRRNFLSRWFLIRIERFLNHWTDILVCVSKADRNLVLKYKTILPEKIITIKNGIDIDKFKVKRELELENSFTLSSIGRLHPPKDFSTILRALKLIISQIKNVKLLIIGDGPLRKSLEREARRLALGDYVKFLGFRKDIPVLISISDLVILSTKWEGLPLVPLEAGAARKPIIASNVEGVRETIIDGETGFLFKFGSARDLADKILKLSRSKELSKKIGDTAYNFVSENFNKERMIREYQNLYQSLL